MHIAKLTRSGMTITIELPPGFDISDAEMEVQRDGPALRLLPLSPITPTTDRWAWLDEPTEPVSQEFIDAIAEIEAADTAAAQVVRLPTFD